MTNIYTHGNVPSNILDALMNAVESARRVRHFNGKNPTIHIAEGALFLLNGEEIPACYEPSIGEVKFGLSGVKSSFLCKLGLNIEQSLSAYVGHEMTHHFQKERKEDRGIEILVSTVAMRDAVKYHDLEREANQTGERVLKELWNLDLIWDS